MPTIDINVKNKIADVADGSVIVCGNSDYVVNFSFDEEWDGQPAKTARFRWNGKYEDVLFEGTQCPAPVIKNTEYVEIGVYSGDLCTTTSAFVPALKSILCADGTHEDPPEDVYNQLIKLLNSAGVYGCGIKRVESLDTENIVNLRDLESGTYILYGYFRPFAGSDTVFTFPNNLAVGIVTKTAGTHVQIPYPVNNCIQFIEITDDSYERKDVYLSDIERKADKTEIPNVFSWANAEQFDKTKLIDPASRNSFITLDGVEYYRYHASAQSFEYQLPNPQQGAVTITARGVPQYGGTGGTRLCTYYSDGTQGDSLHIIVGGESRTVTYTTPADKTLVKITGNYDLENWVLLDMSVMSMIAEYPAPEGGSDTSLGLTGATVGQTVKITEVDENGKPTKWEAVELSDGVSSWNDLTDKPFYKIPGEVYLEPTEIAVTVGGNWTKIQTTLDPDALAGAFVEGKTYIFTWNGEDIPLDGGLGEGKTLDWDNTTDLQNPVYKTYLYISGTLATSDGVFPVTLTDSGSLSVEMNNINTDTHPNGYPLVLGIRSADVVNVIDKEFLPPVDEYIPNLTDYLPTLPEYVESQTDEQIMDARRKMGLYSTYDAHPVVAEDAYMRDDSGVYGFHGLTEDVLSILSNLTQCRVSLDRVGVYDMDVQTASRYVSAAMSTEYLYWLGNGNLLSSVDGIFAYISAVTESKYPDVPFVIYYKTGYLSGGLWGIVWDSTVAPAVGDRIVIENLAVMESVFEHVPEEYIPDSIARKTDIPEVVVVTYNYDTEEYDSTHWNTELMSLSGKAVQIYVTGSPFADDEYFTNVPFTVKSLTNGEFFHLRMVDDNTLWNYELMIPPKGVGIPITLTRTTISVNTLTSPSGKRFRLTVDDTGALSATEITE